MHILFLTDNFPPEVNAPASRTYEHCCEWVRSGHFVTVVTCVPNFPKGKIYKGYRNRIIQEERMDGIKVVRVWTYIAANDGFIRRILDYLSFMISSIVASLFVRKVDVVVGTSPQFFTACAASIVAKIKRVPWVFELRDLWPESIKVVGAMKDGIAIRVLEKLEMFLYRDSSMIISVTNSFKTELVRRGINEDKIEVVTNGVDIARFNPRNRDYDLLNTLKLNRTFVAGYIGTLGMAHGLDTLLDAAKQLKRTNDGREIVIVLLGDGADKARLKRRVEEESITNVIFVDTVAKCDVVRYWSLLDVSIVHLKKSELFKTVIPSKIFESMGMGIPILLGVEGESAQIVALHNAGSVFEPENSFQLCHELQKIADSPEMLGQLARSAHLAAAQYDRSHLADRMLMLLKACVNAPRKQPREVG